ncbi:unnamed protein product [Brassica rapa]|uniref:Uncharacterized protein n=1 Tax=Brassica campestris TaxID=3711 RepID=A0A8D9FZ93_BRACM|nr:unnamed protein product [Brassica rapa]
MDSNRRPVCADGHTWTHTDILCVLTDTHGRPMCADGQPRTATNVLCVLADTHRHTQSHTDSHRRLVCADGQPQTATDPRMSCMCWRTPTDVLCVLTRQPTWAKITRTVHGKGQRAESKDQRADMCTDGQPQTSYTDTHGRTQTATEVLCVLADTHGRPMYVLCVLTDTHGRPVCADGHPQTSCVHPVCADGHTQTSYSPRGPKSPKQSTGRVSVLSPRTNMLICVLMDSHVCPMCADGHRRTHMDTHGQPRMSCMCWRTPTDTTHVGQNHPNSSREGSTC